MFKLSRGGHAAANSANRLEPDTNHAQALLETWWAFGQIMRQRIVPRVIGELDFTLDLKDFFALAAIFEGIKYPKLICDRLAINPSDVSRILEHLEQQSLVTRTLDPDDSRRIQVVLTLQGKQTVEQMRRGVAKHILAALEHLPPEQLEYFAKTMQQFTQNIKAQFEN
ncbi:MAG: MarR family winged helix-turn-helix transcriptional regulator [Deinococcales bacterium]